MILSGTYCSQEALASIVSVDFILTIVVRSLLHYEGSYLTFLISTAPFFKA